MAVTPMLLPYSPSSCPCRSVEKFTPKCHVLRRTAPMELHTGTSACAWPYHRRLYRSTNICGLPHLSPPSLIGSASLLATCIKSTYYCLLCALTRKWPGIHVIDVIRNPLSTIHSSCKDFFMLGFIQERGGGIYTLHTIKMYQLLKI